MINNQSFIKIADFLGNGHKCYYNTDTEEVYGTDQIDIESRNATHIKEYAPLEGPIMYGFMEQYCATVEDFEKQSELMEAIMYASPFLTFKRKVYSIGLADEWLNYRSESIIDFLKNQKNQ